MIRLNGEEVELTHPTIFKEKHRNSNKFAYNIFVRMFDAVLAASNDNASPWADFFFLSLSLSLFSFSHDSSTMDH